MKAYLRPNLASSICKRNMIEFYNLSIEYLHNGKSLSVFCGVLAFLKTKKRRRTLPTHTFFQCHFYKALFLLSHVTKNKCREALFFISFKENNCSLWYNLLLIFQTTFQMVQNENMFQGGKIKLLYHEMNLIEESYTSQFSNL